MTKPIEIREIKAQETYPLRHEVMWPDEPLDFVKLNNDEEGVHFGLFKDRMLLAVVSLFITVNEAQFRKLATKISAQNKGYATLLLQHLISFVSSKQKGTKLWCNARVDKTSFYEKLGMRQTPKTFSRNGQHYIIMEKFL